MNRLLTFVGVVLLIVFVPSSGWGLTVAPSGLCDSHDFTNCGSARGDNGITVIIRRRADGITIEGGTQGVTLGRLPDYVVASRCVELLQAELDCIGSVGAAVEVGPGGVSE